MRPGLIGLLLKLFKPENHKEDHNENNNENFTRRADDASATELQAPRPIQPDNRGASFDLVDKLTAVALGFCLFVVLLLGLVQVMSQTPDYYMVKFEKFGIAKVTHLEQPELKTLAVSISNYLKGEQSDFSADIKGKDAFNQREKDHMNDVRILFNQFDDFKRKCAGVAILLLALTMMRYGKWYGKRYSRLWACSMKSMASFVVAFALLLVVLQFIDFNRYFIMFHQMFFSNDLWELDPATSLLINLLPEEFFVGFVMDTLLAAVGITGILTGLSMMLEKRVGRVGHVDHH